MIISFHHFVKVICPFQKASPSLKYLSRQAFPYALEGEWQLLADGTRAGSEVLATETGNITVDGISIRVYLEK